MEKKTDSMFVDDCRQCERLFGIGVVKCGYGWVTMYYHYFSSLCWNGFVFDCDCADGQVHYTQFVVAVAIVHVDCSCVASFIVTRTVLIVIHVDLVVPNQLKIPTSLT